MIGISRLYCGRPEQSDELRYKRSKTPKPVVVFNCTHKCNLKCLHCYSASDERAANGEMNTAQAKDFITQLDDYGAPVLLFSGGEPLLRADIFDLLSFTGEKSIRTVLSTNGTLIDKQIAKKLKQCSIGYVGISLDGMQPTNDNFRQLDGAFEKSLEGIRNCRAEDIKTGLRLTLNRANINELDDIFNLVVAEGITRVCFYHMVPAGRAGSLASQMLSPNQTRTAMDRIIERAGEINAGGFPLEVLTVNNNCDGAYLYLKVLQSDPRRAEDILNLLRLNGGNASGIAIAAVRWNGDVSPDQFWAHRIVGNVLQRAFSQIWEDDSCRLLRELRNRRDFLPSRCRDCRFIDICNGNFRARAEFATGDPWADDPGCYLSDAEISDG